MSAWKGIESSYLKSAFSGDIDSNGTDTLYAMINNGGMGQVMNNLDLKDTTTPEEKILYGQMIAFFMGPKW